MHGIRVHLIKDVPDDTPLYWDTENLVAYTFDGELVGYLEIEIRTELEDIPEQASEDSGFLPDRDIFISRVGSAISIKILPKNVDNPETWRNTTSHFFTGIEASYKPSELSLSGITFNIIPDDGFGSPKIGD